MSRYRPLSAIVMAAGEGTRMKSDRPKPLHVLCGRPMLLHVLDALRPLRLQRVVVVVGHGAERVTKALHEAAPADLAIDFVEQRAPSSTGDAAAAALTAFDQDDEDDDLLVLPGDAPLLRAQTLVDVVERHRSSDAGATLLTARVADPSGYGRVVRNKNGNLAGIVEETGATDDELAIDEVSTSVYCFRRSLLAPALRRLNPESAQGEYYLSDVVEVLHDAGYLTIAHEAADAMEAAGVNDRVQLAAVEAELRRRINERWLADGVTMFDPASTYVDATVRLARDVTLLPGTMLQGHTVVAAGAQIGPGTRLVDCVVGEGAVVESSSARDAEIGAGAVVGPFAYLAPGTQVLSGSRTGPFYTSAFGDDGGE